MLSGNASSQALQQLEGYWIKLVEHLLQTHVPVWGPTEIQKVQDNSPCFQGTNVARCGENTLRDMGECKHTTKETS